MKAMAIESRLAPIKDQGGIVASGIDPGAMIEFATKQATVLAKVIEDKHLYVVMGIDKKTGKERRHVEVEGWMTLGAMNGLQAATESVTAGRDDKGHYAATSVVAAIRVSDGVVVARAEGYCSSKESKWSDRDEYAIRSMAQTRAASKVFRQSLAWVMVLAGFAATPAEEIPGAESAKKFEAVPIDAPTKKKITTALLNPETGKVVYADEAQKAAIKAFMDGYRFDGWKDFFARGATFLDEVLTILNIPTDFNADDLPGAAPATAPAAAPEPPATAPDAAEGTPAPGTAHGPVEAEAAVRALFDDNNIGEEPKA